MKKLAVPVLLGLAISACTSTDVGVNAPTAEDKAIHAQALNKLMCRVENQARCAHVIENRILFGRFFAPKTLGGLEEDEKRRGRRITTKFIAEAVANINQCQPVTAESVVLVKDLKLAGGTYEFKGTSPLDQQTSACFLITQSTTES